jgi:hypothetical protein
MRRMLSLTIFSLGTTALSACGSSPVTGGNTGGVSSSSSSGTGAGGSIHAAIDKIDLLFMVDNSPSMADKQAILATAVPDLLGGLLNPPCLDDTTGAPIPAASQPAGPVDVCPAGSKRSFAPVLDVHVGLISSSLGTFGANGCPDTADTCPGNMPNTSTNDHGHLVTRTDPCASSVVPTYQSEGFLAWDPAQKLTPPGQGDLPSLEASLKDLVVGDGQSGCGFESQNEAWYRFLVDPSPYQTIMLNNTPEVVTQGLDQVLLQQRQQFLRSDSLLAIVVVTDETDTSIQEFGQYPLFAQETNPNGTPFHLPHGSAACTDPTKGPADACCYSCGEQTPAGCTADPSCAGAAGDYNDNTENLGLRAFGLSGGLQSHKARYGIEWFYQPSRYVTALTSATVQNSAGEMVPNPIFAPNQGEPGALIRDPSLVFYAAITGVPWQLIARQDANGTPDLVSGLDPLDPTLRGGFKSPEELSLKDPHGNTFWDDIAGDPESYVLPLSPVMQESTVPRTGTDPITGVAISPPTSPNGTNPFNGHEWNITQPPGDIEYACIFTLATPRDCTITIPCDCNLPASADNPLCSPNPNDNMKPSLQTSAKAYPGVKNLAIAKGLGVQGIVASICPAQLTSPTNPDGTLAVDYGYRPAVGALIERLRTQLAP